MNNARRKQISEIRSILEDASSRIDELLGEEQDYYDNMPDGPKNGEKGELADAAVNALQSAVDSVNEAVSSLEEAEA